MSAMFAGASNFNAPIGNWDTSNVTNMNSMFYRASLFNQYIGKWKTVAVDSMAYMFFEATNFNNGEALGTSTKPLEWDTRRVVNMKQMFNKASSFNQNVSTWNTSIVRDMYAMFAGATVFNQDVGGWQTGEVINMGSMFTQAPAFNQNIGGWETSKVTSMSSMFSGASSFNQNIGSWDTGAVTNMYNMFRDANLFNNGEAPGESSNTMNWNIENVNNIGSMFRDATAFNQNIGSWNTGAVTNMSNMFQGATNFNNGEAPGESNNTMNWDTKSLQYVTYMFLNARAFNQNIGSWNTSNITGMLGMFMNASSFNHNLNNWDTRKVTSMMHMFNGATVFNNGDIAGGSSNPLNWDTSKVNNMYAMFVARDFNQPFGPNWNTANVRNMSDMFRQARSFNQYIGDWNTSNVTNMAFMFQNANVFNNGAEPSDENKPLNWNTNKVKNMMGMFNYAYQFNQSFGDNWNTTNVENMARMFDRASQFNQDISSWNISKVENFTQFLNASNMQYNNYDKLLNEWSKQTVIPSLIFDAHGIYYCSAQTARNTLTNSPKNWTINDAGQNCPPQNFNLSSNEIDENETFVGNLSAIDPEGGNVTYILINGDGSEDNDKFILDTTTGSLTFINAPDFENPTDLGDGLKNNTYSIRVRATDNVGIYVDKIFIIKVLDVDDFPPEIQIISPIKMSKGPITNTTIKVSDRFSITSLETTSQSTVSISNLVCTPDNPEQTDDINFPFVNKNPSPENHLSITCTLNINSTGKLVLEAKDNKNNSIIVEEDNYIIDTLGPDFEEKRVDITSDGNSLDNPTIYFKAIDDVGVEKYEIKYYKNNNAFGLNDEMQVDTYYNAGSAKIELDPDEFPHQVEIIAYDTIGNFTMNKLVFSPEITFITPTTISNTTINNAKVKITSSMSTGTISNITLSGSASSGVTLSNCKDINNKVTEPYLKSVTCDINNINNTGMLIINAKDDYNGSIGFNSAKFFIDTTLPMLSIETPTLLKNSSITDTKITLIDENYVDKIVIDSNSTADYSDFECTKITDSKITCTLSVDSTGSIIFKGIDKASNEDIKTINYIIDKEKPNITIDNEFIYSNNQTDYKYYGTCTFGDSDLLFKISNELVTNISVPCLDTNKWEYILDMSLYEDGDINVSLNQKDEAGNETTITKTIIKDTKGPTIYFDNLDYVNSTNQDNYLINGYCESNNTLTLKINEITYNIDCTENKFEKLFNFSSLEDGIINLTLIQSDDKGNITQIEDLITKKVVRPNIKINSKENRVVNKSVIKFSLESTTNLDLINEYEINIIGSITAKVLKIEKIDDNNFDIYITNMTNNDDVKLEVLETAIVDKYGNFNYESTYDGDNVYFDNEAPIITINGDKSIKILKSKSYIDLGAKCIDNYDKNCVIDTINNVNTSKIGTYEVIYIAKDSLNQESRAIRQVIVYDNNTKSSKVVLPSIQKEKTEEAQNKPMIEQEKIDKSLFIDVYKENPTNYHESLSKSLIISTGRCSVTKNIEPLDINDIVSPKRVNIISGLRYELDCSNDERETKITIILGKYYKNFNKLRFYNRVNNKLIDITKDITIYNEDDKTLITYYSKDDVMSNNIFIGEKKNCYWYIILIPIILVGVRKILKKENKYEKLINN